MTTPRKKTGVSRRDLRRRTETLAWLATRPNGAATILELGEFLGVSPKGASAFLLFMVDEGLIQREGSTYIGTGEAVTESINGRPPPGRSRRCLLAELWRGVLIDSQLAVCVASAHA